MKKLILGLGAIALIAIPVACTVSCANNESKVKPKIKDGVATQLNGEIRAIELDSKTHTLLIEDLSTTIERNGVGRGIGLTTITGASKEVYESLEIGGLYHETY